MALCDSHSGSHWLSMPLSGILLPSLAHCSLISRIQSLIGSQGPCLALSAAATLTHFLPLSMAPIKLSGIEEETNWQGGFRVICNQIDSFAFPILLRNTVGDSFERLTPWLALVMDRQIDAFLGHRYHRKRRIISETCRADQFFTGFWEHIDRNHCRRTSCNVRSYQRRHRLGNKQL